MKIVDKIRSKLFDIDISVMSLFVFSVLGSIVNYAFQLVLGNILATSDYGDFNTINSLSSNLMCFYSPLAVYACRVTAENQSNMFSNRLIYQRIFAFSLLISFIIMILGGGFFILVPQIRFGAKTFLLWVLVLVMTVVAGIYTVLNGVLQGSGQLGWYGFLGFWLVVIKMGGSYAGVHFGGQVPAVVWAMLLSYVVVIGCIFVVICRIIRHQCRDSRIKSAIGYREILQLYGLTFFIQMLISLYINGGEIILMNCFYGNEAVGLYSLAANVAKIGMYVLSIFTSALLPSVSLDWGSGVCIKRKFHMVMAFAFGIGGVWFLLLSTIGRKLALIFLGKRYYEALSGINYMALWIIGLGMLLVVNTFYLAVNRLKVFLTVLMIVTGGIVGYVAISGIKITYVPIVIGVGIHIILLFSLVDINRVVNPN